ncbi:MAG: multidrug MFS transporter [Blastopirellula sp.]|nr:MAG: multidrug MFS transporter [Blastopirellula sp.]
MPKWKRFADILGAMIGLVCLSPLLLIIALFIKLSSKGPVIFAQQRTGRNGKPFWIYKFRSMVINAEDFRDDLTSLNEQDGPAFKIQNDPRITWIGHWLRSLSLDELPQLWNVLKGDMSIVGPRPLPCHEADQCEAWQRQRATITPGITCVWQVQDRSVSIPFAEWMRMDIRYSRSISLKHDLKLIMQTFFFLVGRRNY